MSALVTHEHRECDTAGHLTSTADIESCNENVGVAIMGLTNSVFFNSAATCLEKSVISRQADIVLAHVEEANVTTTTLPTRHDGQCFYHFGNRDRVVNKRLVLYLSLSILQRSSAHSQSMFPIPINKSLRRRLLRLFGQSMAHRHRHTHEPQQRQQRPLDTHQRQRQCQCRGPLVSVRFV